MSQQQQEYLSKGKEKASKTIHIQSDPNVINVINVNIENKVQGNVRPKPKFDNRPANNGNQDKRGNNWRKKPFNKNNQDQVPEVGTVANQYQYKQFQNDQSHENVSNQNSNNKKRKRRYRKRKSQSEHNPEEEQDECCIIL